MPSLLHIKASPTIDGSVSRDLSQFFVDKWAESHLVTDIETLDLAEEAPAHFGPDILAAMASGPEGWSDATKAAVGMSDKLCTQLEKAETIVISAPLINFSMCTQLKAWIDHVTVAGRTFKYSAPGVAKGLLFGKKAYIIETQSKEQSMMPTSPFDYQEPLLKMNLFSIGIFDITFVRTEPLELGAGNKEAVITKAKRVIDELTA